MFQLDYLWKPVQIKEAGQYNSPPSTKTRSYLIWSWIQVVWSPLYPWSWVQIEKNIITGNKAELNGGGIYLEGSVAIITENTISTNTSSRGGGLSGRGESQLTVLANRFHDNVADEGGAMWLSADTSLSMRKPDDNEYISNLPDDIYRQKKEWT